MRGVRSFIFYDHEKITKEKGRTWRNGEKIMPAFFFSLSPLFPISP
jgi:hypothetical protein